MRSDLSTARSRRFRALLLAGVLTPGLMLPAGPAQAARLNAEQAAVVTVAQEAATLLADEQTALIVLAEAEALEAVWQGGQSELDRLEREASAFEHAARELGEIGARIKAGGGVEDLEAVEEAVFVARGLLAGKLPGVDVARVRPGDLIPELGRQAAERRTLIAGVQSGMGTRPDIEAARAAAGAARARVDELIGRLAQAVGRLAWVDPAGLAASWSGLSVQRLAALTFALAQIGKPYVFASQGPRSFDCSGLTTAAWKAGGRRLTPYSFAQKAETVAVAPEDLLAGDLVFWDRRREPNRSGPPGHVAMFLGGGLVVEASGVGQVRVSAYKTSYLAGYGHVHVPEEAWSATRPAPRIVPRP